MRLGMNASTVRRGGGFRLLRGLIEGLGKTGEVDVTAFVPRDRLHDLEGIVTGSIELQPVARVCPTGWARMGRSFEAHACDAILNLGSWNVPTRLPQLPLFHWAFAVCDDRLVWDRYGLGERVRRKMKGWLIRQSWRLGRGVIVQTETIRDRVVSTVGDGMPVWVLPNPVDGSRICDDLGLPRAADGARDRRTILFCPSDPYPHKNLEILVDVAELSRSQGPELEIHLTIDETRFARGRGLLEEVRERRLGDIVRNLGYLDDVRLREAYDRSDFIVFPTLLESYSSVYLEAMLHGVPIITSDRDFAREVCGRAAEYVDPLDPVALLQTVRQLTTGDRVACMTASGFERVRLHPDWETTSLTLLAIMEEARSQ